MKILIALRKIALPKGGSHPHFFKPEHLETVKKAAGRKAEVFVCSHEEECLKHAADADVIAGFPMTIPPLAGAKKLKWPASRAQKKKSRSLSMK